MLGLKAGTALRGIPSFLEERIMIRITAGATQEGMKRISLACYDREDLLEGIYYDKVSYQLEDEIKESVVDEILASDFRGNEWAQKGVAINRKYRQIYIEKEKY